MREFKSISEFVAHLESLRAPAAAAEQRALHEGGRMIQREAQSYIGEYQDAQGPFPAWEPLADTTLEGFTDKHGVHHPGKIEMEFAPPDNPLLRTDELHDHIELSVTHHKAVVGVPDEIVGDGSRENPIRNIGDVAKWLEEGDREMQARSFLGRAAFVKGKAVAHMIAIAVISVLRGTVIAEPSADEPPF